MFKLFGWLFDRKRYKDDAEYMIVMMNAMNAFRQW